MLEVGALHYTSELFTIAGGSVTEDLNCSFIRVIFSLLIIRYH